MKLNQDDIRDLQKVLEEQLVFFKKFCKDNELTFFLAYVKPHAIYSEITDAHCFKHEHRFTRAFASLLPALRALGFAPVNSRGC